MQKLTPSRRSATQTYSGILVLLSLGLFSTGRGVAQHTVSPQVAYSSRVRNSERALPQAINTADAKLRVAMASASAVSVAVADFDGDGSKDLVTGYATSSGGALVVQRGSAVALAPTATEQALLRAGQPVHPFVSQGTAIALPVRPDFLKVADLDFNGTQDIVVAAKGATSAYLLRGDGSGGVLTPVTIPLSGALGALELWRNSDGTSLLAAGVCTASGCGLQMVDGSGKTLAFVPTAGNITAIAQEKFNNNAQLDLAVAAGGSVQLIDAKTLLSGAPRVDAAPAASALTVAGGFFVYDRRALAQLAVLDASGTLHILAREGTLDNTAPTREQMLLARHTRKPVPYTRVKGLGLGWQEVETLPNMGGGISAGSTPLLLRGRLTTYAMDDLALLNGVQYVLISHKVDATGDLRLTTPIISIDSTSAPVSGAVATRMSADPRSGVVMANLRPTANYSTPSAYRTITVNTTTDDNGSHASTCSSGGSPCSLRSAIALANSDAGSIGSKVDVINLPAGTYTLSVQNNYSDPYGDQNYHLNVAASVSFVGAGCSPSSGPPTSCLTIINANGTTTKDNAFDLDGGETTTNQTQSPYHIYFSGIEIENGKNNYNPSLLASGGYNYQGGAIDFESDGSGTLSMNNMLFASNSVLYGEGGAIFTSNSFNNGPAATVEIDNSSFTNNTSSEFGGALNLGRGSDDQPIILTSDSISGSTASYLINTSDPSTSENDAMGGGLTFGENETGTISTITGSTFSGNTANGPGGGIESIGGFTMTGSTVTGNTSNATAGFGAGGGIHWASNQTTSAEGAVTITTSTITSNTVPNATTAASSGGGGIWLGGGSGTEAQAFSMHYSRIYGNTNAGSNANGLYVEGGVGSNYASFTATDNWWGCNGPASGTGCDTSNAGSTYLSPYTTLALNLSTMTTYEGGSITATASLGQDSSSTIYSAANDTAYLATPITTFTLTKTGTVTYNPSDTAFSSTAATSTSYAAATATGTTNAIGSGTATLTVDGTTVTKTYTIVGPPTIAEGFNPASVAPNANSTVTFTLGNPSGNGATVTGVAFSDILPTGLVVSTPSGAATSCSSGTVSATAGGSSIALSGASISVGATCIVTVNVNSASVGSYTNTTGNVTASNGGTGSNAAATLTVAVTPTKLVYTASPATPITAGGNAGTVQVALEDGSGNIATANSTTLVTLAVTGASGYSKTYMATSSNGVATFNLSGVPLTAAGSYTYAATASGLTSASTGEAVNPGPVTALAISGLVSETAPGVAQTAVIKPVDSYGNVVTSFTGTVSLTSTDPSATLSPASYTYMASDFGTHSFSVTLNTAGTQSVTATSSSISGTVSGLAIGDAVLVIDPSGSLLRFTNAGVATSPAGGYTGGGTPTASIAIDSAGDIFSLDTSMSKLVEFSKAGTPLSGTGYSGGGISSPVAVAVDGAGSVWVANGNGTISQFSNTGTAVSASGGYTGNSSTAAGGIAIDLSGNVWISTPGANTVTEVIGGAAPVAPLAVSVTNVTTGAKP
jgi:CSLREA domain-containing protein